MPSPALSTAIFQQLHTLQLAMKPDLRSKINHHQWSPQYFSWAVFAVVFVVVLEGGFTVCM